MAKTISHDEARRYLEALGKGAEELHVIEQQREARQQPSALPYPTPGEEMELRYEKREGRRIVTFIVPCRLERLGFGGADERSWFAFHLRQNGKIKRDDAP